MSIIKLPPWGKQPPAGAQIDFGNELAEGLQDAFLLGPGGLSLVNLAKGSGPASAGSLLPATTPAGTGLTFSSAAIQTRPPQIYTGGVTALVVGVPTTLDVNQRSLIHRRNGSTIGTAGADGANNSGAFLFAQTNGVLAGAVWNSANAGVAVTAPSATLSVGLPFVAAVSFRGNGQAASVFQDGARIASATQTVTMHNSQVFFTEVGGRTGNNNARYFAGQILFAAHWWRGLLDEDLAALTRNPWQLFKPQDRRIWVPAGGGGGGNTVSVPAGALVLSGFAPTVTATANQSIAVPAGALSLTAFAPTVTAAANVTIAVPAGALNLTALAPTVTATANNRITPPAGTLTLTAFAPTVAAVATQTISVPAGSLTLTGFAPTVTATQNQNVSVPNGALVLTGFAPNVSGVVQTIAVPSGTLVLAAFAPTVSNGAEEFTSSAVFYVPLRMVSGLWSTAGVSASIPADKQAWLPPIRQPIAYVDQRDGRTYCDPAWYRAFEFVFESRLGGRLGPSIPDVVSTVAATQETAAAASATIAEVAQQTQANAEALFVVREVVQGGALDGAEQIPGVDLR